MTAHLVTELIKRQSSRRLRIGVIGDPMQDIYIHGVMERISPEAPCPVFKQTEKPLTVPGGSWNVLEQYKHWNVDAVDLGQGQKYYATKTRYYVGDCMVARYDQEPVDGELSLCRTETMLGWLREQSFDVVVLSDYHKGTLQPKLIAEIASICRRKKIKTVADHKKRPLNDWSEIDVVKCNRHEWLNSCVRGYNSAGEAKKYTIPDVVITRGAEFPSVHCHDPLLRPLQVLVKSVCGAGDCFTAFLALALGHGFELEKAAMLAHYAGGAYVQHRHNTPILPHEVLAVADPALGKQFGSAGKLNEAICHRHHKQTVAFTNGCFDLLTPGHVKLLQVAKQQGDVLVVAVNDDAGVRRLKGNARPLLPLADRMAMLAALSCVDYVISFAEQTPEDLIRTLQPDILVKGEDSPLPVPGHDLVKKVVLVPLHGDYHSSNFAKWDL